MLEFEIGRAKRGRRAWSFDDIAIVPSRRTRDPEEVSTAWQIDAYRFEIPVLAALLAIFLPLYLFLDRVPVNTAAFMFSHLGILATLTGLMDYYWAFSLLGWTGALVATLAFASVTLRESRT